MKFIPIFGSDPIFRFQFEPQFSLFGIFQTALIVGVLSEALVIPPDEKRILASIEKQSTLQIVTYQRLIRNVYRIYMRSRILFPKVRDFPHGIFSWVICVFSIIA